MKDFRFDLPELNTWRQFNNGITQERVIRQVETWEAHGYRIGCVCMDAGWFTANRYGDWQPDPRTFPDMPGLVRWLHDKGYMVRLWIAPAQVQIGSAIFDEVFPHAVMKDKDGTPVFNFGLGTYRLDTRVPLARDFVRETVQRLVRDLDVDAFKLDFPAFYEPYDDYYMERGFHLPEEDVHTVIPEYYRLIRESVDEVKPGFRIEPARPLKGCQAYVDDIIIGDFCGHERTEEVLRDWAIRLRDFTATSDETRPDMVPWFEMVWGEGSQEPTHTVQWWAGFLEYIAYSINYELKIEHSFPPFDYPNEAQIRLLTNLYGPRHRGYKVLQAGRKCFDILRLREAGVTIDRHTRFLVAPEEAQTVVLPTARLHTNATNWHCRDVLSGAEVSLRARNEYWAKDDSWCRVEFEALPYRVYELWHDGPEDAFYADLLETRGLNREAAALKPLF